MFKGSITALITPFKNGEIDWTSFENFVEWQIEQGSHGLVPCGTTGESPTLSHDEHCAIVKCCVDIAAGRVPVIAGAGSNSTAEAVAFTESAKNDGTDAVLSVVPYYNKPTQEGLYAHFKAVQDVGIPVILYNVPGRSVVDMEVATVARLAELPNIVGIKDATGDLERPAATREACGETFCQLSGEDDLIGAFLKAGGDGIISVLSNVAPKACSDMHNAWMNKDLETFENLQENLMPLAGALFCEVSPSPVKYAVNLLDRCPNELRLPLLPASEEARIQVEAAMKIAELL